MPADNKDIKFYGRQGLETYVGCPIPQMAMTYEPSTLSRDDRGPYSMWVLNVDEGGVSPFCGGNVYSDGKVCWGGNTWPFDPRDAWSTWWEAPFNSDLIELPNNYLPTLQEWKEKYMGPVRGLDDIEHAPDCSRDEAPVFFKKMGFDDARDMIVSLSCSTRVFVLMELMDGTDVYDGWVETGKKIHALWKRRKHYAVLRDVKRAAIQRLRDKQVRDYGSTPYMERVERRLVRDGFDAAHRENLRGRARTFRSEHLRLTRLENRFKDCIATIQYEIERWLRQFDKMRSVSINLERTWRDYYRRRYSTSYLLREAPAMKFRAWCDYYYGTRKEGWNWESAFNWPAFDSLDVEVNSRFIWKIVNTIRRAVRSDICNSTEMVDEMYVAWTSEQREKLYENLWKNMAWVEMASFSSPQQLAGQEYDAYPSGAHGLIEVMQYRDTDVDTEVRGLYQVVKLTDRDKSRIPPSCGGDGPECPECGDYADVLNQGTDNPEAYCGECDYRFDYRGPTVVSGGFGPCPLLFMPYWQVGTDLITTYNNEIYKGVMLSPPTQHRSAVYCWGEFLTADKEATNEDS